MLRVGTAGMNIGRLSSADSLAAIATQAAVASQAAVAVSVASRAITTRQRRHRPCVCLAGRRRVASLRRLASGHRHVGVAGIPGRLRHGGVASVASVAGNLTSLRRLASLRRCASLQSPPSPPGLRHRQSSQLGVASRRCFPGVRHHAATAASWVAQGTFISASATSTVNRLIKGLDSALSSLRTSAQTLGTNIALLNTRLDFTKKYVNTLEGGSSKLTLADINEESANLLALQTRQQLGIQALAFAGQAEQSVLGLFR